MPQADTIGSASPTVAILPPLAGEPAWLAVARQYLGVAEITGPKDNPVVVGFFRRAVGRPYPDETAWCAGWLASCLLEAGIPASSLPPVKDRLWARSYLNCGSRLTAPRLGCIVVYQRGGPSTGHVNFFLKMEGETVVGIGGNQSKKGTNGAVTITRIHKSAVLGYRWPGEAPRTIEPAAPAKDLRAVQAQLQKLGYYEVGEADGQWGNKTRDALRAFKRDNDLPETDALDAPTLQALFVKAAGRPVAVERATANETAIADHAAVSESKKVGLVGKVTAAIGAGWATVQSGVADQVANGLYAVRSLRDEVEPFWPWIKPMLPIMVIVAGFAIVIWVRRIRREELESYRTGETP